MRHRLAALLRRCADRLVSPVVETQDRPGRRVVVTDMWGRATGATVSDVTYCTNGETILVAVRDGHAAHLRLDASMA